MQTLKKFTTTWKKNMKFEDFRSSGNGVKYLKKWDSTSSEFNKQSNFFTKTKKKFRLIIVKLQSVSPNWAILYCLLWFSWQNLLARMLLFLLLMLVFFLMLLFSLLLLIVLIFYYFLLWIILYYIWHYICIVYLNYIYKDIINSTISTTHLIK